MYNKIIIEGVIVSDPYVFGKAEYNSVKVVILNDKFKTSYNKNDKDEANFFEVFFNDKLAELISNKVTKAKKIRVMITGKLVEKRWIDENTKEKRSKIFIKGETINFIKNSSEI